MLKFVLVAGGNWKNVSHSSMSSGIRSRGSCHYAALHSKSAWRQTWLWNAAQAYCLTLHLLYEFDGHVQLGSMVCIWLVANVLVWIWCITVCKWWRSRLTEWYKLVNMGYKIQSALSKFREPGILDSKKNSPIKIADEDSCIDVQMQKSFRWASVQIQKHEHFDFGSTSRVKCTWPCLVAEWD